MSNSNDFTLYVKTLLENNNIIYWLDCGDLLQYMRGDHIAHNDIDCDFGVFLKDFYKILDICRKDNRISFKAIWNGEIAIYDANNPSFHMDFFCYSDDNKFMYLHDYVMNFYTKRHDLERIAKFLKSNIFPLQQIDYKEMIFPAPNNLEAHLFSRYGDWRTPNPNWTWIDSENVCNDYKQFAILTNLDCVQKIKETFPKGMYNLYIDKTWMESNEPFIFLIENKEDISKIPLGNMWLFLVLYPEFEGVTVTNNLKNPTEIYLDIKLQKKFQFDTTADLSNNYPLIFRRNTSGIKIGAIKW